MRKKDKINAGTQINNLAAVFKNVSESWIYMKKKRHFVITFMVDKLI